MEKGGMEEGKRERGGRRKRGGKERGMEGGGKEGELVYKTHQIGESPQSVRLHNRNME